MAAKVQTCMALGPGDLNDADEAILDELHEGRNTPKNIADATGYTREYITARIRRLREHGHIENIGGGVYQVVDDPRKG